MDIEKQYDLEHLFLSERRCRTCGELKNLIDSYYLSRKNRGTSPSAYSYECKKCTIERIKEQRQEKYQKKKSYNQPSEYYYYPDW